MQSNIELNWQCRNWIELYYIIIIFVRGCYKNGYYYEFSMNNLTTSQSCSYNNK
jgi:hypothetical protein